LHALSNTMEGEGARQCVKIFTKISVRVLPE
jgi:hypothetical protein